MLIQSLENAPTVSACVTDNAPVMLAAMREFNDLEKYSKSAAMTKIGCVLHHLSLLFKELITLPMLEQTVQEARDIAVFFKRRNNTAGVLEGRQKEQ